MLGFTQSNLDQKDAGYLLLTLFHLHLHGHVKYGLTLSNDLSSKAIANWLRGWDRKAGFMFRAKASAVGDAFFLHVMRTHSKHSLPLDRLLFIVAEFFKDPKYPHAIVIDGLLNLAEVFAVENGLIKQLA